MHEWDVEAEVEDLDDLLSQLYILNSNFCSCTTLAFVTLISVLYPKPFLPSCIVPIIFIRLLDLVVIFDIHLYRWRRWSYTNSQATVFPLNKFSYS